jgi:hypothetical protein
LISFVLIMASSSIFGDTVFVLCNGEFLTEEHKGLSS